MRRTDLEDEMRLAVEILVVWLVASPVVGVLLGVCMARAGRAAAQRGELTGAEAPTPVSQLAETGRAGVLAVIPAPSGSPEVLRLRLTPRS